MSAPAVSIPAETAAAEPLKLGRYSWYPALGAVWLIGCLFLTYLSDVYLTDTWASKGCLAATRLLACLAGIVGLLVSLGYAKLRMPAGVLVNPQNLMSLSRLQAALWTILVLGIFSALALARVAHGTTEPPLAIAVGSDLWGLLGISSGALVGTPLLLSIRRDKIAVDPAKASAAAAASLGEPSAEIVRDAEGPLYRNAKPKDARFSDVFEGDEISNTHLVDLAKAQMFFFTVISAFVWFVAAVRLLQGDAPFASSMTLPDLPSGMVTLLGVSNVGYLANKLVNHTPTTSA
jgi:hypothetical protein